MNLDQLSYSDQRIVAIAPIGRFAFEPGLLVKIEWEGSSLSLRSGNEVARVSVPREHDVDWIRRVLSTNAYLAEVLSTPNAGAGNTGDARVRILRFDWCDRWIETQVAGVDDRAIADVGRFLGSKISTAKAVKWLENQLVLSSGDPFFVVSSGSGDISNTAFRVLGSNIAVDFSLEDEELLISRVTSKPRNRNHKLTLIHGRLRITDRTRLGRVTDIARLELQSLSRTRNSFLALWNEYSELERQAKKVAAESIGWAPYISFEMRGDGSIEFRLKPGNEASALIEKIRSTALGLEASRTRSYLESSQASGRNESRGSGREGKGFVIGDALATNTGSILLVPERDISLDELPRKGEIYGAYTTDSIRIGRRDAAQHEISLARTAPARQLALILAGKRPDPIGRIKRHEPISPRVLHLLGGSPTPAQVEAIDMAINSQDLVVIQGPPGTGKTRVIAAIQARLAEIESSDLASKRRVLFASYQHEAVENLVQASDDGVLPAVKIGARHKGTDDDASLNAWTIELGRRLEERYRDHVPSELLGILRRLQERVAAYQQQPFDAQGTIELLEWVSLTLRSVATAIAAEATGLARNIQRKLGGAEAATTHRGIELLARRLRTSTGSFEDDGVERAKEAYLFPSLLEVLDTRQRVLLGDAALGVNPAIGASSMAEVQRELLDAVMNYRAARTTIAIRPEVEALLMRAIGEMTSVVRSETTEIDLAISDYREAVSSRPGAIRKSIEEHTRALAATCQQSVSGSMKQTQSEMFDTVILDEAARANPLDLMIPMSIALERIILVGDQRQLPQLLDDELVPLLAQRHDRSLVDHALRRSMFERLFTTLREQERTEGTRRVVTLDRQFRMHPALGRFISENFYEPFGERVENGIEDSALFSHGLTRYGESACGWIDVPHSTGGEIRSAASFRRPAEASVIVDELKEVLQASKELTIGVVTFYSGQVEEIWQQLADAGLAVRIGRNRTEWGINQSLPWMFESRGLPRLRIGTVDAFQGREFDVVFLSTVRSPSNESKARNPFGFLVLPNRLNVAMSRQRKLLIAVGDGDLATSEMGRSAVPQLAAFHDLTGSTDGFRR